MVKQRIGFFVSAFANIVAFVCICTSVYFFARYSFANDGTDQDYGLQVLGLVYLLFTLPSFLVALLSLKVTNYPKDAFI
mgnify:CR=1 FL=1